MTRNGSNNSNMLGGNVYNNLIRNYYLANNTVNMKKKKNVKQAPGIQGITCLYFTSIYNVKSGRLKQNTCCSPNDDILVRDICN